MAGMPNGTEGFRPSASASAISARVVITQTTKRKRAASESQTHIGILRLVAPDRTCLRIHGLRHRLRLGAPLTGLGPQCRGPVRCRPRGFAAQVKGV